MNLFKSAFAFSFFLAFAFNGNKIYAQTLQSYVPVKTPEASAFERHIETPVSMYTGVPNINIPLYSIDIKGVTVPITLNYHAGGIRVDQEATWVGLGWDLDYGGQISRTVRGVPDEKYFITAATQSSSHSNIAHFLQLPNVSQDPTLDQRLEYVGEAKDKLGDLMPDEFHYSAGGFSGKYMFNQGQNKFILFPKEDVSVQAFQSPPNQFGVVSQLYSWRLTLPDGATYNYGSNAITSSKTGNDIAYTTNSWLIKSIHNTENDSIAYSYANFSYDQYKLSGQSFTLGSVSHATTITTPPSRFYYNDCRPTTITFPNGTITFISSSRADMPANSLTEIDVKDASGTLIKKILFQYSYFYGNTYDIMSTLGYSTLVSDDYKYRRLRLDKVTIVSGDGTIQKSYAFSYYTPTQMPSKYSFAQDHWGFYNGMANTSLYSFIPNFMPKYFTGGDRRVNPAVSNVFALKSITYPEGGSQEFIYENNTAGLWATPFALLNYYQDNNLLDKYAAINVSGPGRLSAFPSPDYTDGNGTRYFYKTFTINNPSLISAGYDWVVSTNFGISSLEQTMLVGTNNAKFVLEQLVNSSWVEVREFNTHPSTGTFSGTDNDVIATNPGQYRLTLALVYAGTAGSAQEAQPYHANFQINWREVDPTTQMINVGGLRIKDIKYHLTNGNLAKMKHYDYINQYANASLPTFTSGRVISMPMYYQLKCDVSKMSILTPGADAFFFTLNSQSSQPLETTSGSYSGYEYVQETDVDTINNANSIKAEHHFSFNPPYNSQYYPALHLAAYESAEWTRGKLLYSQYYKGNALAKREDFTYYVWSPHLSNGTDEDYVQEINTDLISYQYLARASGCGTGCPQPVDFYDLNPLVYTLPGNAVFAGGWYYGVDSYNPTPAVSPAPSYAWSHVDLPNFIHYTGFDKPQSKKTTSYESGHPVVQVENYYYEKTPTLYQVSKVQTFNSMKDTLEQRMKYPADSSSVSVYNHMIMRHIVSPVIVQSNYKNSSFLKSVNTNYQQWTDTTVIAPVRSMAQIGSASPYTQVVYQGYDSKGNVLSASKSKGAKVSYQWGYNSQYAVAEVKNAATNDIFYESFEEGAGNSTVNDANSGHFSHTGAYSRALTGLDNGSYLLTYWQKSGSVWTLSTNTVTVSGGSYTISVNAQIDDVRFYPSGALMTTYTYDPLVGVTSVTDVKDLTSYYEYDGLQRLINIKDKDGNIVKHIDYHHVNQ